MIWGETVMQKPDVRTKWWSLTLDENLVECRVVLPQEGYDRVRVLANLLEEKLPFLLGKFVISALRMYERGSGEPCELDGVPSIKAEARAGEATPGRPLDELCRAILWSRFPDDNGAARMRQCAMVTAILVEGDAGNLPSVSSIARLTGNHPSQIMLLAQVLEERNILMRVHAKPVKKGRNAKILQIRADAVASLNAAHIVATGHGIFDAPVALPHDQTSDVEDG